MKLLLTTAMALGVCALSIAPAYAATGKTCIKMRDIKSTTPSQDGTALNFEMRDGQVYRNELRGGCPSLKYNGFVWVMRQLAEVCDNEMSLQVLQSNEVCMIGKFTETSSAPKG